MYFCFKNPPCPSDLPPLSRGTNSLLHYICMELPHVFHYLALVRVILSFLFNKLAIKKAASPLVIVFSGR